MTLVTNTVPLDTLFSLLPSFDTYLEITLYKSLSYLLTHFDSNPVK